MTYTWELKSQAKSTACSDMWRSTGTRKRLQWGGSVCAWWHPPLWAHESQCEPTQHCRAQAEAQANATMGDQPPPWGQSTSSRGATETQNKSDWDSRLWVRCSAYKGNSVQLTLAAEVNVALTFASVLRKLLERSSWNWIRIPVGWGVVCLPLQKF